MQKVFSMFIYSKMLSLLSHSVLMLSNSAQHELVMCLCMSVLPRQFFCLLYKLFGL